MEHPELETTQPFELETAGPFLVPARRAAHCASLSVIVLSIGDHAALEGALASLASRCRRLEAEVIVVSTARAEELQSLTAAHPSMTFIDAPLSSTVVQMRELGMSFAGGDIVSLRNAGDVGDGSWLAAFDATVGVVDEPIHRETEIVRTVVSDDAIAHLERELRHSTPFARVGAVGPRHELGADAAFLARPFGHEADISAPSRSEI